MKLVHIGWGESRLLLYTTRMLFLKSLSFSLFPHWTLGLLLNIFFQKNRSYQLFSYKNYPLRYMCFFYSLNILGDCRLIIEDLQCSIFSRVFNQSEHKVSISIFFQISKHTVTGGKASHGVSLIKAHLFFRLLFSLLKYFSRNYTLQNP